MDFAKSFRAKRVMIRISSRFYHVPIALSQSKRTPKKDKPNRQKKRKRMSRSQVTTQGTPKPRTKESAAETNWPLFNYQPQLTVRHHDSKYPRVGGLDSKKKKTVTCFKPQQNFFFFPSCAENYPRNHTLFIN